MKTRPERPAGVALSLPSRTGVHRIASLPSRTGVPPVFAARTVMPPMPSRTGVPPVLAARTVFAARTVSKGVALSLSKGWIEPI